MVSQLYKGLNGLVFLIYHLTLIFVVKGSNQACENTNELPLYDAN